MVYSTLRLADATASPTKNNVCVLYGGAVALHCRGHSHDEPRQRTSRGIVMAFCFPTTRVAAEVTLTYGAVGGGQKNGTC